MHCPTGPLKPERSQLPIRKLLSQAGHAFQAIRPVFMMSPISVAQFLEPGILEFDYMVQVGTVTKQGEFIINPGSEFRIRSRQDVQSINLKKPELLPPAEIEAAIVAIVQVNPGIEPDDLAREASLLFGFKSTSAKLKNTIHGFINELVANRKIESRNGRLYLVTQLVEDVVGD